MTWIHLFEEDAGGREVYRPEDASIPLSRRPRERLQIRADGSASVFLPGPDDRFIEHEATWDEDSGAMVIHLRGKSLDLVIIDRSPSRLLIERRQAADKR